MRLRSASLLAVAALTTSALATGLPTGTAGAAPAASTAAAPSAPAAAAPLGQAAVAKARAHLRAKAADFGLSAADVDALGVSSVVPSKGNGLTNVYFQQRLNSIPIANALLNVAVRADGSVFRVASSAVADAGALATTSTPKITDVAAATSAAKALGLTPTGSFESGAQATGSARSRTLAAAGISHDPIPVQLTYQRTAKGLALTWQLVINQLDSKHWWNIAMDAGDGAEVDRSDWVDEDSHNVFPFPTEAPSFGPRQVVTNPATSASPFGWNDTNGAAGAESTRTIGNNVSAYTDTDANDAPDPGSSPDGGASLVFNFPLNLANQPSTYRPAAVSNLYYANNRIHDIMYRFGFDEESGNFQINNYGNGGLGTDSVNAEAQDGEGTDNANFGTPPDGQKPRMQMFVWSGSPQLDGDLDNGIIIHEYGHGISNRLTGGPANVDCLDNSEQGGEGWSDFYSLAFTQPTGTEPAAGRGIGTYALDEPTSGPGIRTQKYSTNMSINTHTYDDIASMAIPHGVGEVWATMLWDLYWAFVDQDGWTANLNSGNAGNTKAIQLVTDGLKQQVCSPGFVDARDAILAADEADNGGANQCLIWTTFARRGLGFSAEQGSSDSTGDNSEAFDLPPACLGIELTATASPDPVPGGQVITYDLKAENVSGGALRGVVLKSRLSPTVTYVAGSATCGGVYTNGNKTVTFTLNVANGATKNCSLQATAQASPVSRVTFEDDFEPNLSAWTASHGDGTGNWRLSTAQAHSPTHSAFASDPDELSDKYLRTTAPVAVAGGDTLSFWHTYDMEPTFDGGVVEVSTNGGSSWADVGAAAYTQNGYDAVISNRFDSPIANRQAFTGNRPWRQSVVNLNAYAGQNVLVRFRAASDSSVDAGGWYVDDVEIGKVVAATNHLTLTVPGFPVQEQDVVTRIVAAANTVPGKPTVTNSTPRSGRVTVAFTPGSTGGSPITSYQAQCQSTDGGVTKTKTGAASPLAVTGLTAGKNYRCRVRATNAVGTGAYSAYGATVLVPGAATAPPAPTVTNTTTPASGVRVRFTSGGDGGSPITGYQAQCASGTGGPNATGTGTASPILVTADAVTHTYRCRVRATNAVGTGAWSSYGSWVGGP